jgi:HPt (histidine-containing phosphotransfer) domain-containing protein
MSDLEAINALPVLDQNILNGIRRLTGEAQATPFLEMLAIQYLEDAPEHLAQITAAFTEADATQLAHAVHRLRSSSASLGGAQLARICNIVETLARSQQLEAAQPYQQPLYDLANAFQNALCQELLSEQGGVFVSQRSEGGGPNWEND